MGLFITRWFRFFILRARWQFVIDGSRDSRTFMAHGSRPSRFPSRLSSGWMNAGKRSYMAMAWWAL